jgi:hypothetical protein
MRPRSMPDSHANDWLRLALDLGVLPVAGFLRICTGSLTSCLTCTLFSMTAGVSVLLTQSVRSAWAKKKVLSLRPVEGSPVKGTDAFLRPLF